MYISPGYPAGELWAATMPMFPTLETFEAAMNVTVRLGFVERRGNVYHVRENER